MKPVWRDFFLNFIPGYVLSCAISAVVLKTLITGLPLFAILLLTAATLLLAAVITYNKYVRIGFFGLAGLGAVCLLFVLLLAAATDEPLFPFSYSEVMHSPWPAMGVVMGIALFFFLFAIFRPVFPVVLVTVASVYLALLYMGYPVSTGSIVLSIVSLYPVFYRQWYSGVLRKLPEHNARSMARPSKIAWRTMIPCLLMCLVFLISQVGGGPLLGKYRDPVQKEMEKVLQKVSDALNLGWNFSVDLPIDLPVNSSKDPVGIELDGFSLSQVGFGDSGKLGGDAKLNTLHLLTVNSTKAGLYLGGSSYDLYTGSAWSHSGKYENNRTVFETSRQQAELPLVLFEEQFGRVTDGNIPVSFQTVRIWHTKNFRTNVLFAPTLTTALTMGSPSSIPIVYTTWEERYEAKSDVPSGKYYEASYYQYSLTEKRYQNSLWETRDPFFSYMPDTSWGFQPVGGYYSYDTMKSALIKRAEEFRLRYLQLPDTVTPRVRNLAEEITRDAKNDYEKAKAIERYLSANYPYTLQPGSVPDDVDFVDYFLFENQKGYCVYFATAMTVLLRCVNVPARYVEGFYVSDRGAQPDGNFFVTGEYAHAWPEVYLEGLGFVGFEPTSGYSEQKNPPSSPTASPAVNTPTPSASNGTADQTPGPSQTTGSAQTPGPSETPDSNGTPGPSTTPGGSDPVPETGSPSPSPTPEITVTSEAPVSVSPTPSGSPTASPSATPEESDTSSSDRGWRMLLSCLLIFLLLLILAGGGLYLRKYYRVDRFRKRLIAAGPEKSVEALFRRMENLLAVYAISRLPSQTFEEYAANLQDPLQCPLPEAAEWYQAAVRLFTGVRYQEQRLLPEDREEMLRYYDKLVELIRRKRGDVRFFFDRYFLGRL